MISRRSRALRVPISEKIITGSFQGFLRIYNPRQQGYKVDDLMEFQLDEPILQIEAGKFVKYEQMRSGARSEGREGKERKGEEKGEARILWQ